jgi:hypothetical protein
MTAQPAPAQHPTNTTNGAQRATQSAKSRPDTGPGRPGLGAVPAPRQTAWDAEELMNMAFPEPRWAVPGIICEGVSLLAGPPKVGKSWMGLNLALDIAAGRPAFGKIPVEQGDVLYLALEDTPRRLQSRMRTVLGGRPAPAGLTLSIACAPMPAGGDGELVDWLESHPDARLIVIDVFAKVRGTPPPGVAAYDADYAAMGRIKRVADHYGIAIVLVHHVRKAAAEDFLATVSGTNGLAGAADAVLVLERARAQADGVLHVTGRDVDETDYPLAFDSDAGAWQLLDGRAEDYQLGETRSMVMRYLRDYPNRTPKEIAEALQVDAATIRQTCRRMAEAQQLRAVGGKYRPANGDTSDSSDSAQPATPSLLSLRHSSPADMGEPL